MPSARPEKGNTELKAVPGAPDTVSGSATVLVVEDEEMLRAFVCDVLSEWGFSVLQASRDKEAFAVAEKHGGPIHLLLTDVVLPGKSGPVLATNLLASRPEMKVLYMSGYADDTIMHHGVLERGEAFLEKPFSPSCLADRVRRMLDSG